MAVEAQPITPLDLGAWQGDRAQLATARRSSYGDIDDLPLELRFQVYVSRAVQARERQADAETAGAAAFILVTPQQQEELKTGRSFDRTVHTGRVRLAARVHFMTHRAASSVFEEYVGDANGVFDRIAELQCDRLPALIYDPSSGKSTLTYYPRGTHTDDGLVEVQLDASSVTEAEILSVIEAVYRTELCTPDNSGPTKIWQNAGKGHPIEEAERTVQQFLRVGLAARFHWCTIRAEQSGKLGRTDLEVVDDRTGEAGAITHYALLELKVLRSFSHSGTAYSATATDDAVSKGVNQAHSYGVSNNSLLRMLCCFDMRTDDVGDTTTFAHVQTDAITLCVSLKRWYMYRSSEHMRDVIARSQIEAANDSLASGQQAARHDAGGNKKSNP
ncbi:hypothetical protein [Cupriavidus metallidurans]|uniref:Uncharacterized protein n=1 Tax=Cupriavidus metallidurans (strain ATCC 43123 / DSM 2839 / NBRC 102507 / CH34) TaxID=266264 RepID=Q1LJH1_CUPMC|nr:hypothetical protein [Cupriavidus metallidurans]ABF09705.1 hypothetical protein Rmet_2832 [Cupriavidus metallidurans CH34]QGS29457.1 hypothetical protein FOB83_11470 [Cupriavidus metallidurans]